MIREEIKQLKTGRRDLRKFSLMVGGVLVLLGLWLLFRHKARYPWLLWPGLLLLALGLTVPKSLKHVYVGWMTLAFILGFIVSNVLLTLLYYVVLTPIGLTARALGKDFLQRTWQPNAATYWLKRDRPNPRTAAQYEQQF